MPHVTIYTDGSALGNPGQGGYGVVMLAPPHHRKELSAGFRLTTNNRMELMAVCVGLEALKTACDVTVYSDSRYVVDSVDKGWVFGWEKKRFKDRKNADLWMRFLRIYRLHNVKMIWVKGHASIPENERCDQLAVAAANEKCLPDDTGYEAPDAI